MTTDELILALILFAAVVVFAWVAQTIRLELARETIAERDGPVGAA